MTEHKNSLINNGENSFFVDSSCIHCGSCWQIDSENFASNGEKAYVHKQPNEEKEIHKALSALVDCPVNAINSSESITSKISPEIFPMQITKHSAGEVFYCGWSSRKSFGASSWLIIRAEGNILIDSPRWNLSLAKKIKEMGGISKMVLTHKDDVADHAKWSQEFNCERYIHEGDVNAIPLAERVINGMNIFQLGDDMQLIPTPGHTKGSMVLLLGNQSQILFSGDHLWWHPQKEAIVASKDYCWWNWEEQLESIKKLLNLDIFWLLPGHGNAHKFKYGEWKHNLEQTIKYLEN